MKTAIHFVYGVVACKNFVLPILLSDRCNSNIICLENPADELDSIASSSRLHVEELNFRTSLNPLRNIKNIAELFFILKKYKPNTIVAHMSTCAFLPLFVSFILQTESRIYFCHGAPYLGYFGIKRLILKLYEISLLLMSNKVIAVSPSVANELRLLGVRRSIFNTHPGSSCGLPNTKYAKKLEVDHKIKNIYNKHGLDIIYVGRPHVRKGFYDLLNILKILDRDKFDIRVKIFGFEENEVKGKYRNLNLQNINIQYMGFVNYMRRHYVDADIVILPSHHEGFGYALLEGAAAGCALVSSQIAGPDAVVFPSRNGFLVDAGDIENYSLVISKYYKNRNILCKHMKFSYNLSKRYSEKNIVGQVLNYLNNK